MASERRSTESHLAECLSQDSHTSVHQTGFLEAEKRNIHPDLFSFGNDEEGCKEEERHTKGEAFIHRSRRARESSCISGNWHLCRAEAAQHIMKLRQFCGETSTCIHTKNVLRRRKEEHQQERAQFLILGIMTCTEREQRGEGEAFM